MGDAPIPARTPTAPVRATGRWLTEYPRRPGYFKYLGEAFKPAAATTGLPIGDDPFSRCPHALLPEKARLQIRAAHEKPGMAGKAGTGKTNGGSRSGACGGTRQSQARWRQTHRPLL
jgi:hypothetical protein